MPRPDFERIRTRPVIDRRIKYIVAAIIFFEFSLSGWALLTPTFTMFVIYQIAAVLLSMIAVFSETYKARRARWSDA